MRWIHECAWALLALLGLAAGSPVKKWQILGPFIVGKNELDGEPWRSSNATELLGGGKATNRRFEADAAGNVLVSFQQVDWQSLVSTVGGQELLEWQARATGIVKVDETSDALVSCQGVPSFRLDGQPMVGDLYRVGLPKMPVRLSAGTHRIELRLRGKLQSEFSCFADKVPKESPALSVFGDTFLTVPDLVEVEDSVALSSPLIAVGVANRNPAKVRGSENAWIRDVRAVLMAADPVGGRAMALAPEQPSLADLAPGVATRAAVRLAIQERGGKSPATAQGCSGEKSVRIFFQGKVAGKPIYSVPLHLKLQCRKRTQSFVYTFEDVDGSVQHAAAVLPQASCKGTCPVLVTLSGTSITARDSADSYKYKASGDEDYTFGVDGSWLVAPTRHGAHNWEGPGLATAHSALKATEAVAVRLKAQAPDFTGILVAGHSMGGHGAWLFAASLREHLLGIASSAGWLRKDQYADSNKVFLHDVATPWVEPSLASILRQGESEFDAEAQSPNLVGVPILIRVGANDRTVHPWFSRRMFRTLQAAGASGKDVKLSEIKGQEHWWWDTRSSNDGGAVNDPEMRRFYASCLGQERPRSTLDSVRWKLVVFNVATAGSKGGLRVLQQLRPHSRSEVSVQRSDGGEFCVRLTTSNIRRLQLNAVALRAFSCDGQGSSDGQPKILLDGQVLPARELQTNDNVELCRGPQEWARCPKSPPIERLEKDVGPIRQIFTRRLCGIYGNEATDLNAIRFMANMLLMTGHTGLVLLRDTEVLRDGVLSPPSSCEALLAVGVPETNQAVRALLQPRGSNGFTPPMQVDGDSLQLGGCRWQGGRRAALALLPWWHAEAPDQTALALVATGSSAEASAEALMLLSTPTIPPMARQPLTHLLPDYVVLDVEETRTFGAGGFLAAGFWDHQWKVHASAWERDCLTPAPRQPRTEL